MDETEQLNIRLPKALLYDLEYISQNIKIGRNDWIRSNLAKIIMQAKEVIIGKFEEKFVEGYLTEKEFKSLAGFNPTDGMKQLKEKKISDMKMGRLNFKNYVERVATSDDTAENKQYLDKYIKGVIKKVENDMKKNKKNQEDSV